jgi:hypothetical protein
VRAALRAIGRETHMTVEQELTYRPAKTVREFRDLLDDPSAPIIRTDDDWREFMASKDPLLEGVPEPVLEEFTKSLCLHDGLGGFSYEGLQDSMTFRQFRGLLGRFGVDLGFFEDHDGYTCSGRGDCKKLNDHICTSNC